VKRHIGNASSTREHGSAYDGPLVDVHLGHAPVGLRSSSEAARSLNTQRREFPTTRLASRAIRCSFLVRHPQTPPEKDPSRRRTIWARPTRMLASLIERRAERGWKN
jgi:hypothetical protein